MKIRSMYLKLIFCVITTMILTNCAYMYTGLPTASERLTIQSGKQVVVLLRIICELESGSLIEPFRNSLIDDNISIRLARSVIVGGRIKLQGYQRYLSPETRKQGWTYMLFKPGIHYLVFSGPRNTDVWSWESSLRYLTRWQINIPQNHPIIYAGSINISCKDNRCLNPSLTVVINEENLAKEVISKYLTDFGSFETVLIRH